MKCEKCGRANDGSCKFYKQWTETYKSNGERSRKEIIVCEPCSEKATDSGKTCSDCGEGNATNRSWCGRGCEWGKEEIFCSKCSSKHILAVEEHRKTCEKWSDNNNPNRERERESKNQPLTNVNAVNNPLETIM